MMGTMYLRGTVSTTLYYYDRINEGMEGKPSYFHGKVNGKAQ